MTVDDKLPNQQGHFQIFQASTNQGTEASEAAAFARNFARWHRNSVMDPEPEASSLVHLKGMRCFQPKLVVLTCSNPSQKYARHVNQSSLLYSWKRMNVSNPLARKVWPSHIHDDTRHMEIFFKHALFLSLRMFEYRQAKSAIYGSHQHTECPRRLVEGCSGCAKTYRTNRPAKCDFPARSVVGPCKPKDGISTFHDLTIPCLADHSIHPPASLPPWPLLWPAPQASLLLAPFF